MYTTFKGSAEKEVLKEVTRPLASEWGGTESWADAEPPDSLAPSRRRQGRGVHDCLFAGVSEEWVVRAEAKLECVTGEGERRSIDYSLAGKGKE